MAGAHRQSCRSGQDAIRILGREDLAGGFFVWPNTQSTVLVPGSAQPETTMTKRIGTGTTLKDFTRRDFVASSALAAALFVAAKMLFPVGAVAEGKGAQVNAPSSPR
ncbi:MULTISPECIES: hypothetical protein [unclassified Mesorhizobium]|uniref:hypothetical protein n=2 Tax=Mesorhizobium TaxID=68287 RepID=UPI00112EF282|nr:MULTISPECIES: hypothetical protein [unclassified Mesorhizobium]MBZ9959106.1 hypothetical protein [Mesorhizobium sp. BR1-1-14]TPK47396.1 hypothetical protein FJ550_24255 [Mesorhizobium sp. B2-5-2]TPL22534.1 hypothetical protein FJ945_18160 [Mesorhizobium sp. B2-4-9]TPL26668.1 hypothetical protein FJ946_12560 [Mesorhizobium sp. B2-4-7]TPL40447.1 hypothetical protein FJ961_16860 [Mesorhizobium sp. B2-4-5]